MQINRVDLLNALSKLKPVASGLSSMPILSHMLIEARCGSAYVTASDLKTTMRAVAPLIDDADGEFTLPAQRLTKLVSEMTDNTVTFTAGDAHTMHVVCGPVKATLYGMDPDEFPPVPDVQAEPVDIEAPALRAALDRVAFAICTDQARYNLTGALFEFSGDTLTLVATDGRRMSIATLPATAPARKVIVPGRAVNELTRLLADEETVRIAFDDTRARFDTDGATLITSLIEGSFPNWQQIIPKRNNSRVTANTAEFTAALRRARVLTNDKWNAVKLAVDGGEMVLSTSTPEVGEYREPIPVTLTGEATEATFNPDFLLDVARHVESDEIALAFGGPEKPVLIGDGDYKSVVMPIRR